MENDKQEANETPSSTGPQREVDQLLVETPTLAAKTGSPKDHKQDQEKTEEDEMNTCEDEKPEAKQIVRQDQFCIFKDEKELKSHEAITLKSQACNGICVKIKIINDKTMDNVFFAIDRSNESGKEGITKLRLEDSRLLSKAVGTLAWHIKRTLSIHSLGLQSVSFSDGGAQDFKQLVDAVTSNAKITHLQVQSTDFNEDFHGKTMARCILESRGLKELDLSYVNFEDPKSFYEMANGLLNERCRLASLRLKGIQFGQLESKVMQFILMRNKSLQALDISECSTDTPENLENVFIKFDQFCNVRSLTAENLNADFNCVLEIFGEALNANTKLESLNLSNNKMKQNWYGNFWELMVDNRSLRKINVSKTEVTDKVCSKINSFLQQQDLRLSELNLSKNQIGADGLVALGQALQVNSSLKVLNLNQNFIRDAGISAVVDALKQNKTLKELYLSFNRINSTGLSQLAEFLTFNSTLEILDLSKNAFSDNGFIDFGRQLGHNKGLQNLNLSKNKDISDEVGLRQLAHSLITNSSLHEIDLNGLKIRKNCIESYFKPALKHNITLKKIEGKIPQGIIEQDLHDNELIEKEIQIPSRFRTVLKTHRRELSKLRIHRIDVDQTQLNLEGLGIHLLVPSLKFIRYKNIQVVNFNEMAIGDDDMLLLAKYIQVDPALRSLSLASNGFTDVGLNEVIAALSKNTKLNHLNLLENVHLSDWSLKNLQQTVTDINMSLYEIELDLDRFTPEILEQVISQAALNRAIQEHLKPKRNLNSNGMTEIDFQGVVGTKVRIADYFESAVKAWRILKTSKIQAVNEGLNDDHIIKLCEFLSGRNQIKSLNLRRNKIGDRGAVAISKYIQTQDKALTSLELERNQISDVGGEALLLAMQNNMRMEVCRVGYGNDIRSKITRKLKTEIEANHQIKTTVVPEYKKNGNRLNEIKESDRGPSFVRCALKSCQLLKILNLSLPDNMIGEKEMIDIAYVLSIDTPLRSLDISKNVVDAKASVILANSLKTNSHLRKLDLRENKLGNAGVAVLLEPFIQQQIRKIQFPEDAKARPASDHLAKSEMDLQATMQSQNSRINKSQIQQANQQNKENQNPPQLYMKLECLYLDQNQQTDEVLKHVYTVLDLNEAIEISIDEGVQGEQMQSGDSEDDQSAISDMDMLPMPKKDGLAAGAVAPAMASDAQPAVLVPMEIQAGQKETAGRTAKATGVGELLPPPDIAKMNEVEQMENSEAALLEPNASIRDEHAENALEAATNRNGSQPPNLGGKGNVQKIELNVNNTNEDNVPLLQKPKEKRTCIEILCKAKHSKGCLKLLCSGLLRQRTQTLNFKTNKDVFLQNETVFQKQAFMMMWCCTMLYVCVGIIWPIVYSNIGVVVCAPVNSFQIYGLYGLYVLVSTLCEAYIIQGMKNFLKRGEVTCNCYVILKWFQGQLASLVSFVHICFIASTLDCLRTGDDNLYAFADELDRSLHAKDKTLKTTVTNMSALKYGQQDATSKDEIPGRAWLVSISSFLAILTMPIVLRCFYHRAKRLYWCFKAQPDLHKLLPNTQRSSEVAFLCNFQAANIIFESVSLSGYLLEGGGPVVPGKLKDMPADYKPIIIVDTKKILLFERLKYQDAPMVVILIISLISHLVTGAHVPKTGDGAHASSGKAEQDLNQLLFEIELIPLIQVFLTLSQMLSGYVSYRWRIDTIKKPRVRSRAIRKLVKKRQVQESQRRERQAQRAKELRESRAKAKESNLVATEFEAESDQLKKHESNFDVSGALLTEQLGERTPPARGSEHELKFGQGKQAGAYVSLTASNAAKQLELPSALLRSKDGAQEASPTELVQPDSANPIIEASKEDEEAGGPPANANHLEVQPELAEQMRDSISIEPSRANDVKEDKTENNNK